ncbi:hypothetical protein BD293_0066 [Roseinatronobacter monicus]|uniref:Uncharacterized protein n=2 Tax=Roseinatronobacter monicus TaxID=393481 RepID=A0A543K8Y7_9RHOB|nr:hypothetical protein BD293_0066 [Roseinatronobacter monicus]
MIHILLRPSRILKKRLSYTVAMGCIAAACSNTQYVDMSVSPASLEDSGYEREAPTRSFDVRPSLTAASDKPLSTNNKSLMHVEDEILRRQTEYREIEKTLALRGAAVGAVKGGIIGLLLADAPGGVLGAFLGGSGGYVVSVHAASAVIREHQEYLIRKSSIEDILEAAREDQEATATDANLLNKYQRALEQRPSVIHPNRQVDNDRDKQIAEAVKELRQRAELRHVALQELAPVYADRQGAGEELHSELQKSSRLLQLVRKGYDSLLEGQ